MNDAALSRLLNERSPWRARSAWEQDDPDMRAAQQLPLSYEPDPLADLRPPGLYVFRGPRRVGKSLEIKRAIARVIRAGVDPRMVLFCSCDGFSQQDLRRLIAQGHNVTRTLPGPRYWFLDEITAVPGWSQVIKDLRDQDAAFREACVVLTGSSARDLEAARKDLADRRGGIADSDRLILPMSFRAFSQAISQDFSGLPDTIVRPQDMLTPAAETAVYELEPWRNDLADIWELFLSVGGFPRAVGEFVRDGAVSDGFRQGLWDVLAGDAIATTSLSRTDVVALMDRLVQNLCSPVNASSVSTDVGLSGHQAVADRIDDLVKAFLAWRCHRIESGRPNTAAQRKVYFVDPLIARLAHDRNSTYVEPDVSQLNEQQIGLAVSRAVSFSDPEAFVEADRVMYERSNKGAEIDFVGPTLEVPYECKYTDTNWAREAQTMKVRYGRGVMVTRSPLKTEGEVWAIPASMLAWILG